MCIVQVNRKRIFGYVRGKMKPQGIRPRIVCVPRDASLLQETDDKNSVLEFLLPPPYPGS